MKKLILTPALVVYFAFSSIAQNTFPENGNVGIGTTNPGYKLEVITPSTIGFRLQTSSSTVGSPQIDLFDPVRGSETVISSTDGTTNGTYIASYSGHPLLFGTNAGSSPLAKMAILTNGNVGIGTLTPSYKLEVVTPLEAGIRLQTNSSTVGNPQVDLYDPSNGSETVISSTDGTTTGTYLASYSGHPLLFGTSAGSTPTAKMTILTNGHVGIGTMNPDSRLTVAGNIHSREVKVTVNAGADFVFEKDYQLEKLDKLETFIKANKHLPEIASAEEMQKNGLALGEMNIKLLQKIEELTLHLIEQSKSQKALENKVASLQQQVLELKSQP